MTALPSYTPDSDLPPVSLPPERSKWPTVIGVLGICWGSLGLCCSALFGLWSQYADSLMKSADIDAPPLPTSLLTLYTVQSVTGAILALILVIGSVQLLRRRRAGPTILNAWAILGILSSVGGAAGLVMLRGAQMDWKKQLEIRIAESIERKTPKGQKPPPMPKSSDSELGENIGLGVGLVLGLGPPVFVAFFLSAPNRREEINSWGELDLV